MGGKLEENDYKDNLGGPDEITSTTLCDSQVCSRSCFGAHRIFVGAHVVAADTPTTTESPATTVPTQPSEGEGRLLPKRGSFSANSRKTNGSCPNRRSKSTDTA